ncbi:FecR family protein [Longitalea luteola]|uniref:FecR family protein n=1 Tax=Longitalea luteola TaxID=2812563 RepID=UPI001A95885B|nr:FecR domain-containing protein [Longitalea luteola]
MNEKEDIVNLIAKQLQGLATAAEEAALQQWLQSDPACQQEYEVLKLIWQKSGPLLANPTFNADIAWLKLDNTIAQATGRKKEPFHAVIAFFSSPPKAVATALALVLIALGGYWWYRQAQWLTFLANDKNETLTLPDRSVVTVRKGSSIKYLKHFDKKERRVQLHGEAFFNVQHNEHQPFFVTTGHTEVKVLGTSFLVNALQPADEVVVVTGKVNVTDTKKNNHVLLTGGQRAVFQNERFYQEPVADSNFIAWKTGQLTFNNAPLPKALQDLAHYYGVAIELAPGITAEAASIHITVQFNNQPIEQVLEEIKLITGLQTKKEKDKILFYRN